MSFEVPKNKLLTKHEAVKASIRIWSALTTTGGDSPEKQKLAKSIAPEYSLDNFKASCPLCQYTGNNCLYCPLAQILGKNCFEEQSLYRIWHSKVTPRPKSQQAAKILQVLQTLDEILS